MSQCLRMNSNIRIGESRTKRIGDESFLCELNFSPSSAPTLLCDNVTCIAANNYASKNRAF